MDLKNIEYETGDEKSGIFDIPDYLDPEPLEVIGNIMYTVTGLVYSHLQIPDMDIERSLKEISSDREKKLWSIYFKEMTKRNSKTIH